MPVAERQRFDVAALESYLHAHVDGFAGPLTVEQFKGGQSNPTFKLITPGKTYVLRSKPGPAAKLLPSAHAIDREFRVMRGLAGSDVPVAKMHAMCEDDAGGALAAWEEHASGALPKIRVQRVNASGALAAGWPAVGRRA